MSKHRELRVPLASVVVGCALITTIAACGSTSTATSGSGASGSSSVETVQTINVAQTAYTGFYWPLYAGLEEGFFTQNGFKVNLTNVPGAAPTIQAVVAGVADVGIPYMSDAVVAINKGAPIRLVASSGQQSLQTLVGAKDVAEIAQLRGKKIEVTAPTAQDGVQLVSYLADHGLPAGTYSLVSAPSSTLRLAALKSGAVSAAVLTSPSDYQAEQAGFHKLATISAKLVSATYVANQKFIDGHMDALTKFVRGLNQSITWLNNPDNKVAAINDLMKQGKFDHDTATAAYSAYLGSGVPLFGPNAGLPADGVNATLASMVRAGQITQDQASDPSKYINSTALQAAGTS